MKKLLCLLLVLISVFSTFALTGCDSCDSCNGSGKEPVVENPIDNSKTEIEIEEENKNYPSLIVGAKDLNLMVGDYFVVKYALKNSEETVIFKSNNTNVATVDQTGTIIAVGVGETLISITAGGTMKTINVSVEASPTYSLINLDGDIELSIGKTYTLSSALFKGNNEVEATFSYISSATDIAQVNGDGCVTAISTGKSVITVSAVKDGKSYSTTVDVYCHEDCYILAEDIEVFYQTETAIPYTVKRMNGETIAGAVVTILPNSAYTVNGNNIKALDFGKFSVVLDYYGIKKTINVTSIYPLAQTEFNYFGHDITISGSLACDMYYYKQPAEMTTMEIVNSVGELTSDKGKFLKVTSQLPSGKNERYNGVYLNSRQSKEKLQELYNAGKRTIRLELMFQSQTEAQIFITFKWSTNKNKAVMPSEHDTWITIDLPLQSYIDNYENLNNITDATVAKNFQFLSTTNEDHNNPYTLYFKPIEII